MSSRKRVKLSEGSSSNAYHQPLKVNAHPHSRDSSRDDLSIKQTRSPTDIANRPNLQPATGPNVRSASQVRKQTSRPFLPGKHRVPLTSSAERGSVNISAFMRTLPESRTRIVPGARSTSTVTNPRQGGFTGTEETDSDAMQQDKKDDKSALQLAIARQDLLSANLREQALAEEG
ncbi:hypothetical protein IAT40_005938 [Kwoniella sp. CBS 6097]